MGQRLSTVPPMTLVIGYGNDLRSDDAAGVRAAGLLAEHHPEQRTIVVRQLTPELAADIAMADRVVFLDAYPAEKDGASLRVERVREDGEAHESALAHHCDPASLLRLSRYLFGTAPEAWVVGIPAFSFDVGETTSPATSLWIDEAVGLIEGSAFFSGLRKKGKLPRGRHSGEGRNPEKRPEAE